ncbi:MAG: DUF3429 domain-containing protein [Pseudomonadota bacterium]
MLFGIPRAALILGLAGLIPFLYGALASWNPSVRWLDLSGEVVLNAYGPVIFAFMSGVLWGFAAKAGKAAWLWLGLSVLPAILIFLVMIFSEGEVVAALMVGFPTLLAVDLLFWRAGLAVPWWPALRVILTAIVTICLYVSLTA